MQQEALEMITSTGEGLITVELSKREDLPTPAQVPKDTMLGGADSASAPQGGVASWDDLRSQKGTSMTEYFRRV